MTTSLTLELYAMSTSVLIKCSKASANRHAEAVRPGGQQAGSPAGAQGWPTVCLRHAPPPWAGSVSPEILGNLSIIEALRSRFSRSPRVPGNAPGHLRGWTQASLGQCLQGLASLSSRASLMVSFI